MTSTRLFVDPLGSRYVARLTPREMSWGVATRLNAVVIETDDGRWVGSASIYHNIRLEDLSERELLDILGHALRNEVG